MGKLKRIIYKATHPHKWTRSWRSRFFRLILFCAIPGIVLLKQFINPPMINSTILGFPVVGDLIVSFWDLLHQTNNNSSFRLLVLSLPIAIGIWIYRNNDKIKDQDNFQISRLDREYEQLYNEFQNLIKSELDLGRADGVKPSIEYMLIDRGLSFQITNHTGISIEFEQTEAYKKLRGYFAEMTNLAGKMYSIDSTLNPTTTLFNKYKEVVRYFADPPLK